MLYPYSALNVQMISASAHLVTRLKPLASQGRIRSSSVAAGFNNPPCLTFSRGAAPPRPQHGSNAGALHSPGRWRSRCRRRMFPLAPRGAHSPASTDSPSSHASRPARGKVAIRTPGRWKWGHQKEEMLSEGESAEDPKGRGHHVELQGREAVESSWETHCGA